MAHDVGADADDQTLQQIDLLRRVEKTAVIGTNEPVSKDKIFMESNLGLIFMESNVGKHLGEFFSDVAYILYYGLKVNIEKTEIVIFYRTDTATTSIKLNEVEVHTKKQMLVLGVIFDSKLEWSFHMENSVKKARFTLQGLRVLNR